MPEIDRRHIGMMLCCSHDYEGLEIREAISVHQDLLEERLIILIHLVVTQRGLDYLLLLDLRESSGERDHTTGDGLYLSGRKDPVKRVHHRRHPGLVGQCLRSDDLGKLRDRRIVIEPMSVVLLLAARMIPACRRVYGFEFQSTLFE